ncbi:HEPN domain-containing protein [Mesorhizobium denitrificans]|uniref:HEPN domain-containing protein n=1 Tax=Mesorhizobium denitrificans TaxID=2294114 RepID=UPI0011C0680E|nr:HEPN domain-containing protein [Mesorhizobium denitrificans]
MPSQSAGEYETLIGWVDQIFGIHGQLQQGRGRRHEQEALHRASVVLTVAAWESYVEKILQEALNAISVSYQNTTPSAPQWSIHAFEMRRAQLNSEINKFNTPNSENVRRLFNDSLGFDPWPAWQWRQGRRNWASSAVRERINNWLNIRHSIAHGFALPAQIIWLAGSNGQSRLTLNLVKECRELFDFLVRETDRAFSHHLMQSHGMPAPW